MRLRHCADCDQHYETRDRLCPTCGAAFVPTASSSAQPDPWFAGGSYPTDDLQVSRAQREVQQQLNNAAWLEGRPDINYLPEAMQQRILQLINGQGLDVEGEEGGPGGRSGLSEEDIARLPLSQLHTTSSMLMSGTSVCRAYVRLSVAGEVCRDRQTSNLPLPSSSFVPSTSSRSDHNVGIGRRPAASHDRVHPRRIFTGTVRGLAISINPSGPLIG